MHAVDIIPMDDEFGYVVVDRAPVRSLSLKRRSAGLTVLDLLHRKKNLRVAAVLLAGLLDSDDSSDSDSDSDSGEEEEDDDHVYKDDILCFSEEGYHDRQTDDDLHVENCQEGYYDRYVF